MSTLSEPTAAAVAKPSEIPSPSAEGPFLRFYHSDSLRAKTLALLKTIEQAPDATKHRDALSDLVMELTDSGFDYFFVRALKLSKAGFVTEQSAHLGLVSVKHVLSPVVHNIIWRMNHAQLRTVCVHIRSLMV